MSFTLVSEAVSVGARKFFARPFANGRANLRSSFAASLALGALACLAGATGASAAPPKGYFLGVAYATFGSVKTGPLAASLGPTAYIPCPCLGTNGEPVSNKLVGIGIGVDGKLLKTGALRSVINTVTTSGSQNEQVFNSVDGVTLFDGLISASAIRASAHVTATGKAITTSDNGSMFVNLKIAGKAMQSTVAPNTRIDLAGLGYVTLRREAKVGDGVKTGSLTVDMVAVTITKANAYGLPIGAQVVVGHAIAGYVKRDIDQTLSGTAYATVTSVGVDGVGALQTGLTAFQALGCGGTDGKSVSNYASSVILAPVASMGNAVSTVYGKGAFAQTQSTIDSVSLLDGLISASGIKSVATTSIAKGVRTRSTDGTAIATLKVLGIKLPIKVKPNTKVGLPGLGYVVLNEQYIPPATSSADMSVNAIRVVVTTKNSRNLPVGAQIIIGHASSGVTEVASGS